MSDSGDVTETQSNFYAEIRANYPWLDQLGLTPAWFQEAAATSTGPEELLTKMRETPQFKRRFPGMYRPDGTMRANEADYMKLEEGYRNLLRQFGYDGTLYADPSSLVGLMEGEVSVPELSERLTKYRQVEQGGQAMRDAFYVYAGLDLTTDDLYTASVDSGAWQNLTNEYNRRTSAGAFDYSTWITRATEVGLNRVAEKLSNLEARGAITSQAVQSVLSTQPDFARTIMDAIYTGGTSTPSEPLSLQDLISAFEYASVGAAASRGGLTLPTKERLGQIRQAGVDNNQAMEAYANFGANQAQWSDAAKRGGYDGLSQEDFESGAFLGEKAARRQVETAVGITTAAGKESGSFRFSEERDTLVQSGFGGR